MPLLMRDADAQRRMVVYCIRNLVNGKLYVGMTEKALADRVAKHVGAMRTKKSWGYPVYRAFRRYGVEMFRVSVLCEAPDRVVLAAEEKRLIALLKPHYNCTRGGEGSGGWKHRPETIAKFSASLKGRQGPWRGKKRSRESVEKGKATRRARGTLTRYWLGKRRSPETIARIVETKRRTREAARGQQRDV